MIPKYRYTIEGIARANQADAGSVRTMTVIAHAPEQAIAWANREWHRWVDTQGIVHTERLD